MKRSKPLARTSRLSPVGATARRRKARALPEGPMSPGEWRLAVWDACRGRCVQTGRMTLRAGSSWEWHAHHPVEKQKLAPEHRFDPRNGVVLARHAHERHTARFRVVPFEALPDSCMLFAQELGDWAVAALLREHPPA